MADSSHVEVVRAGTEALRRFRSANPDIRLDLQGAWLRDARLHAADLREADLRGALLDGVPLTGADLREANAVGAHLSLAHLPGARIDGANLYEADLRGADLRVASLRDAHLSGALLQHARLGEADLEGANLQAAILSFADLSGARMRGADLWSCRLWGTRLAGADLRSANLQLAVLVDSDLRGADLRGARVFGVSAWNVELQGATQADLIVTADGEPRITVGDLEVAQFVHLLLANERLRKVIDTVTSKTVLILGRFRPDRKAVLDGLRDALRARDLVSILFDFDLPTGRDVTETVTLLARMARYVVADLTEPSSIPQELQAIAPEVSLPIQPILQEGFEPWSMWTDLRKYPWVLPVQRYRNLDHLLGSVEELVVAPTEAKRRELLGARQAGDQP